MKLLITLISVMILTACSETLHIQENVLIKSKYYIGHYISSTPFGKNSIVLTSDIIVTVKGQPDIPDNVLCYIRFGYLRTDVRYDIAFHLQDQWFTWAGSEDEYMLINNVKL